MQVHKLLIDQALKYCLILSVMPLMRLLFCCSALVTAVSGFADVPVDYQPSGLDTNTVQFTPVEDVVVSGCILEPLKQPYETLKGPEITFVKEDTTEKEEEPVLQPLILAGSGAIAVGTGLGIAGVFSAPILIGIALLFFAAGAWLTAIGWRKLKDEPKKYKGEKIAIINYLVMGILGVAASFYSLYVLFSV